MVTDEGPGPLGDSFLGRGGDEVDIALVVETGQHPGQLEQHTRAAPVVVCAGCDAVVAVRLEDDAVERRVGARESVRRRRRCRRRRCGL